MEERGGNTNRRGGDDRSRVKEDRETRTRVMSTSARDVKGTVVQLSR